jgi:hypothetical protein
LYKYGTLDTRYIDEIFDIGYQAALTQMDQIFAALNLAEDENSWRLQSAFSEN